MIFNVSDKDTMRKLNPVLNELSDFDKLTDDAIRLACYMYDYDSPFRHLPEEGEVRMNAIKRDVKRFSEKTEAHWDKFEKGKGMYTRAARAVKKLQYDQDVELYISYCEQLAGWQNIMSKPDKSDKEVDQAIKIAKEIIGFLDVKKQMEIKLGKRIDDSVKERIKASTIEMFMDSWDGKRDTL